MDSGDTNSRLDNLPEICAPSDQKILMVPLAFVIALPHDEAIFRFFKFVIAQSFDMFVTIFKTQRLQERIAEADIRQPARGLSRRAHQQREMIKLDAE